MKSKWHLIFLFFLFIIGFATATVQRTEETLVKDSFQVDPSNYRTKVRAKTIRKAWLEN